MIIHRYAVSALRTLVFIWLNIMLYTILYLGLSALTGLMCGLDTQIAGMHWLLFEHVGV